MAPRHRELLPALKEDFGEAPKSAREARALPRKILAALWSPQHLQHNMAIPLEDNFTDIIGKAQRGLEISDSQLAEKSKVPVDKIRQLRDGKVDEDALSRVAPVLQSRSRLPCENPPTRTMETAARGSQRPRSIQHALQRHDGKRLSCLGSCKARRRSHSTLAPIAAKCSSKSRHENLKVEFIFLTHAHPDHIEDLDRLRKKPARRFSFPSANLRPAHNRLPKENIFRLANWTSKHV